MEEEDGLGSREHLIRSVWAKMRVLSQNDRATGEVAICNVSHYVQSKIV